MDRRKFLKMLGIGGGAALVAPLLPESPNVGRSPEEVEALAEAERELQRKFSEMAESAYAGGTVVFIPNYMSTASVDVLRNRHYWGGSP